MADPPCPTPPLPGPDPAVGGGWDTGPSVWQERVWEPAPPRPHVWECGTPWDTPLPRRGRRVSKDSALRAPTPETEPSPGPGDTVAGQGEGSAGCVRAPGVAVPDVMLPKPLGWLSLVWRVPKPPWVAVPSAEGPNPSPGWPCQRRCPPSPRGVGVAPARWQRGGEAEPVGRRCRCPSPGCGAVSGRFHRPVRPPGGAGRGARRRRAGSGGGRAGRRDAGLRLQAAGAAPAAGAVPALREAHAGARPRLHLRPPLLRHLPAGVPQVSPT